MLNLDLVEQYSEHIKKDLIITSLYKDVNKDILIVVRDQLDYLKFCIESIRKYTKNYNIFIWDNNSNIETKQWLKEQGDIKTVFYHENLGFIIPNNELIKLGDSPYVILLNSDTIVYQNWDKALISQLQNDESLIQVGYAGGILDHNGRGSEFRLGESIDYICGWCFCIKRETYNKYGLFDSQNLEFAYGEDSDFSLRLKQYGNIKAIYPQYVYHFGNKTIQQVRNEQDCTKTFNKNHMYIKKKWIDIQE